MLEVLLGSATLPSMRELPMYLKEIEQVKKKIAKNNKKKHRKRLHQLQDTMYHHVRNHPWELFDHRDAILHGMWTGWSTQAEIKERINWRQSDESLRLHLGTMVNDGVIEKDEQVYPYRFRDPHSDHASPFVNPGRSPLRVELKAIRDQRWAECRETLLDFLGDGWATYQTIVDGTDLHFRRGGHKPLRRLLQGLEDDGILVCDRSRNTYRYRNASSVPLPDEKVARRGKRRDLQRERIMDVVGDKWLTRSQIMHASGVFGSPESLRTLLMELCKAGHLAVDRSQRAHRYRQAPENTLWVPNKGLSGNKWITGYMGNDWCTRREIWENAGRHMTPNTLYKRLMVMLDEGVIERDTSTQPHRFRCTRRY